ncbi:MAG: hypothetical protein PSN36_07295 [Gammaproteobacteria bacterium]|nr:hypothetical protein [Gammaproteobacteria bacterium]
MVKNTRQKLFNIRDKAFLNSEHNEEYYRFRDMLNTLIRFAHNVSWQRLLFDFIILRKEIREVKQQANAQTKFNNAELDKLFLEGALLIIRLIYLRSPVLILLSTPLVLLLVIKFEVLSKLQNKVSTLVVDDASIYAHH